MAKQQWQRESGKYHLTDDGSFQQYNGMFSFLPSTGAIAWVSEVGSHFTSYEQFILLAGH